MEYIVLDRLEPPGARYRILSERRCMMRCIGGRDMAKMVRKQLYIERHHDERLKRYARASGRTQADVVREAVEQYAVQNRSSLALDAAAWAEALAFMRKLAARRGRRRSAVVPREQIYGEGMARRGSRTR